MQNKTLVVGLSITGQSVLRYYQRTGKLDSVIAFDENLSDQKLLELQTTFPRLNLLTEPSALSAREDITLVVKSPGVPPSKTYLKHLNEKGIPIIGDIELFAQTLNASVVQKVIAITGTNGKSTVTHLVGELLLAAGFRVAVAGNIGLPVLDRLTEEVDYWVLELSSFQLETTFNLHSHRAIILNISDDHLDRYDSFEDYVNAKQRIYKNAEGIVYNLDDERTHPSHSEANESYSFSLREGADFCYKNGQLHLSMKEGLLRLKPDEIALKGLHNLANVLACAALLKDEGISSNVFQKVLRSEKGLAHRCQEVKTLGGVLFINDSKGTNVGASVAAIDGLATSNGNLVLIAGGLSKDADLEPLAEVAKEKLTYTVLIGQDKDKFAKVFKGQCPYEFADSLEQAINIAYQKAKPQGVVLFSPAAASFDMFDNFSHRGECYIKLVERLT